MDIKIEREAAKFSIMTTIKIVCTVFNIWEQIIISACVFKGHFF